MHVDSILNENNADRRWVVRNNLNGTDIGKRCTESQIKKIKKTCGHVKLKKITSLFFFLPFAAASDTQVKNA